MLVPDVGGRGPSRWTPCRRLPRHVGRRLALKPRSGWVWDVGIACGGVTTASSPFLRAQRRVTAEMTGAVCGSSALKSSTQEPALLSLGGEPSRTHSESGILGLPGHDQAAARSQELRLGLPCGWQRPSSSRHCCLPGTLAGGWVGRGEDRTGTGRSTPAAGVPRGFAYCAVPAGRRILREELCSPRPSSPASLVIHPPPNRDSTSCLWTGQGAPVSCAMEPTPVPEARTGRRKGGESFGRLRGGLERKWGTRPASLGTPQLSLDDSALKPGGERSAAGPWAPNPWCVFQERVRRQGRGRDAPDTAQSSVVWANFGYSRESSWGSLNGFLFVQMWVRPVRTRISPLPTAVTCPGLQLWGPWPASAALSPLPSGCAGL